MNDSWDYIVIGAGHNGLSAGCTLARAGKSVLLVDQRPIIGGLAASHAYLPEAPEHLLSLGAMDDALLTPSAIAREYELARYGYEAIPLEHPYGWMNEDGDTLLLFSDFDRTVEEIRHYSPADARAYVEMRGVIDFIMGAMDKVGARRPEKIGKLSLAGLLMKLARDKAMRRTLGRMLSVSAFEMIAETFESEAMRGLWAFWSGIFAPGTVPSGGIYLSGFGNVHRAGIFRPRGGMSGLMRAFEGDLRARGGEIRLNSRVQKIMVEAGRAVGVRLDDGTELQARHGVLANCAPQVALGELLEAGVLDARVRQQLSFMPANSIDVAPFKIDIATRGRLGYPRAEARRRQRDGVDVRKTTFMTGTLEDHLRQHEACKRGEPVNFQPPMYMSILSANDRSITPADGDVLYLYANVPVHPAGGWDGVKQNYSRQIMSSTRRFMDGLDSEIGRVETSPADFTRQFGAPRGCYFHVDMIVTRLGSNRPAPGLGGYRTPVEGLYLAGSGSHPSGGVCGLPGKHGAETALQDN